MESVLNYEDLCELQKAFLLDGNGYGDHLSLNRTQFCETLALVLNKGTEKEYGELFDKIDVTNQGSVDWDKFASYMLMSYYEQDDRVKLTQVPQWKDLKSLKSPHKDVIQKVAYMKNANKYLAVSKEGTISLWDSGLKLQKSSRMTTDIYNSRDLWVTSFVPLYSINKIALSFTSKEIAIYDLSMKLDFNCVYRIQGLDNIAISIDYWCHPENVNHGVLMWGDTAGVVAAIQFNTATTALFERQTTSSTSMKETCFVVQLKDVAKNKFKAANMFSHHGHSEWVRQVHYSAQLECFISCSTTWTDSIVLGWVDKGRGDQVHVSPSEKSKALIKSISKISVIQISQGITAFDYLERLNLIATAGVNSHVCLWNPYVVSKPTGVLRGHVTCVTQICFVRSRNQLISYSKDKVLRIWDVQLQVCIQRLAGIFPKLPDVHSVLYFDERLGRLFMTFNADLTVLELKPEIKDRTMSHDAPIVGAFYNQTHSQVVTASENGTVSIWMIDSGQKVKQWTEAHGPAKLTAISPDHAKSRILTGASDGTVKIWDYNGRCHNILRCTKGSEQVADVGQILSLKRNVVAVGWTASIAVFQDQNFQSYEVETSDWKGGTEHTDDVLSLAFLAPSTLATGSYNGEIIIWNLGSERVSRRLLTRIRLGAPSETELTNSKEGSVASGGFDSHAWKADQSPVRPKSRAASRISLGGTDEMNEFGHAVTCLAFLVNRPNSAANLVSCGGNGWVRFWNMATCQVMAEYVAHVRAGSIVMAVDQSNHWLASGDVDGVVKLWDISNYCTDADAKELITEPPRLEVQEQLHTDIVSSLEICVRNGCTLILSSSIDCSVRLYDVSSQTIIGTFGQEVHWRIDPVVLNEAMKNMPKREVVTPSLPVSSDVGWEPDARAVEDPANYRISAWEKTSLGKEYQELRLGKRERRQPQIIRDLPYLQWEKMKLPAAGPHNALETSELRQLQTLEKPDFIHNPHKYFSERPLAPSKVSEPVVGQPLQMSFDEKTIFPKFVLDYEAKMRQIQDKTTKSQPNKLTQSKKMAATATPTTSKPGKSSKAASIHSETIAD